MTVPIRNLKIVILPKLHAIGFEIECDELFADILNYKLVDNQED